MNYYGCEVLGVEADHGDTADIVIHLPESIGPELFMGIPIVDIEGWPDFTDHSRAGCCTRERDLGTSHAPAVAHPDPTTDVGSGTNFPKERR
ncbi:DUF7324 family protein [Gordonia sp. 852002-10350_SCH5691597]|uniref:DUF7324 family protein n=1 Tax=Gordonia sp. 852002-10350_SCH5691597 TaxID=1834085 RepID=UPI0007EB2DEF|nr:hypothetical protein [Gordonia sp. 852002-10350_SCH5691597]OBA56883.1 hypothetical protein A5777_07715 [Gordonia sp. 852002-10350_SCH5691597]